MTPIIEARDLVKTYGTTPALSGASLAVAAGEVVAVVGASGSGKSTLMHCMAGIVRADAGSVRYDGVDVVTAADAVRSLLRRRDFGFVFQFGHLVPELSCLENTALPLRLNGVGRREAERTAREWLERLGVEAVAAAMPADVSGGEQQRVAIGRALISRPKVVFADEPTGALDSLNGERVMQLFTGAARETDAAIVLVTHEVRVAAYADREVVVRDGRTSTAPVLVP